jgi:hypothetical protein
MQPHRSEISRPLTGKTPKRRIAGVALLPALVLALVTACGSGGNSNAGAPGGAASPASLSATPAAQIPATPPDVPSGTVTCPSSLPNPVSTPSDLQGLIGLCANQDGSQLEVINVSEDVLDIYPATSNTLLPPVSYDVSSDPLPTRAGELEVEAQNAAVAGSSAPAGADLLAIGGTITAVAANPPAKVYVGVDRAATEQTFLAAAWTSYVMGIDSGANPDDYYQSIADCVNSAASAWQALQAQPPPGVGQLLFKSLVAVVACKDLQDKVNEYLKSRNEHEDVPQETLLAGKYSNESDWALQFQKEEDIQHDFATDIR